MFKPYFNIESNKGTIVLLIFLIGLFLAHYFFDKSFSSKDFEDRVEISELEVLNDRVESSPKIILKNINPNTISYEDLIKLKLSEKLASTWVKFRLNFKLKDKNDVLKIYGVSNEVDVESSVFKFEKRTQKKELITKVYQLDLNLVNQKELRKVDGIGEVFSNRIIKYRDLLGGFYKVSQLKEVYGITDSIYAELTNKVNFVIDTTRIEKVYINEYSFKEVLAHPYFSYDVTQDVFNLKKKQDFVKSLGEIKKLNSVSPEIFSKIAPYISL